MHTFRAVCEEEPECVLGDKAVRIFLNTRGNNEEEVSKELVEFLHYIEDTTDKAAEETGSEHIKCIHERVLKLYGEGMPPEAIARECDLPEEQVRKLVG